eukprot:scaffold3108_cov152-Cylindrotheca_fusiformis.AAC.6
MGTSQSAAEFENPKSSSSPTEKDDGMPTKRRRAPPNLSGPALVDYKCRKKKKAWSRCVGGWYKDRFLPGKALEDERSEENCDDLFENFKQCYMKGMLAEQKKKGLQIKEGSILGEYVEEQGFDEEKN